MTQTKQEIRQAWDKENLKRYNVTFHKTNNADLIEYVEERKKKGDSTSEIFREAIEQLANEG